MRHWEESLNGKEKFKIKNQREQVVEKIGILVYAGKFASRKEKKGLVRGTL